MRELFELAARPTKTFESYDRIMARYAPTSLLVMPATWAVLVIGAFVPIYWGLGLAWREALITSGSSFTTLGFARPAAAATDVVCFIEALIGLGLVALLISYLPAIYSTFARREAEVVKLEVRAGSPPSAVGVPHPGPPHPRARLLPGPVGGLGAVVRRARGEPRHQPGARVLPLAPAQELVDHRGRHRPRHRRADRVDDRHRGEPAGPDHDPVGLPRAAPAGRVLPPALRPRPGP